MHPCEELANAKIVQAAGDYWAALRKPEAKIMASECENFFKSA